MKIRIVGMGEDGQTHVYEADLGMVKYHLQKSASELNNDADILHDNLCPGASAALRNRAIEAGGILQDLDRIFG